MAQHRTLQSALLYLVCANAHSEKLLAGCVDRACAHTCIPPTDKYTKYLTCSQDVARRSREEERREKLARRAEMSQEEALAGAEDAINAWEGKDSAHQANEAEHGRSGARAMYARVSNKVYKMVETDEFKNVILFVIILVSGPDHSQLNV